MCAARDGLVRDVRRGFRCGDAWAIAPRADSVFIEARRPTFDAPLIAAGVPIAGDEPPTVARAAPRG